MNDEIEITGMCGFCDSN